MNEELNRKRYNDGNKYLIINEDFLEKRKLWKEFIKWYTVTSNSQLILEPELFPIYDKVFETEKIIPAAFKIIEPKDKTRYTNMTYYWKKDETIGKAKSIKLWADSESDSDSDSGSVSVSDSGSGSDSGSDSDSDYA